jgi:hypothetical protein
VSQLGQKIDHRKVDPRHFLFASPCHIAVEAAIGRTLGSLGGSIGSALGALGVSAADVLPPVAVAAAGAGALGYLHQFAVPRTAAEWPDEGQFKRAYDANAAFRRDPEAAHARAFGAMPTPHVDVKVGISVSGDLKGLINATVTSLTKSGEFTHGPSTRDDHSSYAAPDMANC